jgi:hypothetical protein
MRLTLILLLFLVASEGSHAEDFTLQARRIASEWRVKSPSVIDAKVLSQFASGWQKAATTQLSGENVPFHFVEPTTPGEVHSSVDKLLSNEGFMRTLSMPKTTTEFNEISSRFKSDNPSFSNLQGDKIFEYWLISKATHLEATTLGKRDESFRCLWPFNCGPPPP